MRGRHKVYFSGRMKRDFWRAVLSAGALAAFGVVLVFAALQSHRLPEPVRQAQPVTGDSCAQSLARWQAIEPALIRAMAQAADIGNRCRLLTCPEIACASLQDLRGTVIALSGGLDQIAAAPDLIAEEAESKACGAVIAPLARRLQPGLHEVREALDLCAVQARCSVLRKTGKGTDIASGLSEQLRTDADRIGMIAAQLRLSESPAAAVSLDLLAYTAGDAIEVRAEAGRNRCLAQGGTIGVYPDRGKSSLADPPLSQTPLTPGSEARLLLEAPASPGAYLVAITGQSAPGRALGIAPFSVEAARAGCSGFSGLWESDRGTLRASVRRGVLRGTYRRPGAVKPGFLTGHVKGRHFHGAWVSELGAGGAHLVLSGTGDRFLGTAGDKPGEEDGAGLWRGRCIAAP